MAENETQIEPALPPWCDTEALAALCGGDAATALLEDCLSDAALDAICQQAFNRIALHLPNYQLRREQIQMATQILHSFYHDRNVVIEAATGVGKSFAYLVALLAFSYLRGVRVLVTTETRALQWQLFEKDLPFLRTTLDPELTFALCLGSANYFCQLRYETMLAEGSFRDIIGESELTELRNWAAEIFTRGLSGSRLEQAPKLPEDIWQLITRDSDGCTSSRCPHYSSCNYYRVRRQWSESRILVANHHLLLFHLLNDKHTLPHYAAIAIDEAHALLRTGYAIFTITFGRHEFAELRKHIEKTLQQHPGCSGEQKQEIEELLETCHNQWETLFSRWEAETELFLKESGIELIRKRLAETGTLAPALEALAEKHQKLLSENLDAALLAALQAQLKKIEKMVKFAAAYDQTDSDRAVFWAEKNNQKFYLNTCELNLGETLSELMTELRLYTSATMGYWPFAEFPRRKSELISRGFFQRFISEMLPQAEHGSVDCNVFFSPFNYREHAALYVPDHLPAPEHGVSEEEQEHYFAALCDEIAALVSLSRGGALVLFTSNYSLKQIAWRLRQQTELTVYSQLEEGVQDALAKFRRDKESVLLGSLSFWQGVDIAGDGLRLLIITKLLFTPPDDPIFRARSELLEQHGKKPFFELALPYSATMLRQGFGRLIRTERDKGVVALLDSRIWQKNYGRILLANLPRVQVLRHFAELEEANRRYGFFHYELQGK
ncbi:MAG: ATP-dependent DNA helicase [Turneriella sp.]|nr:ATP-dependent DNA helicase [Turneriella sp.]